MKLNLKHISKLGVVFLTSLSLLLSCHTHKVGGPCEYMVLETTVVYIGQDSIHSNLLKFQDVNGSEKFTVSKEFVNQEIGFIDLSQLTSDSLFIISVETITKGSCVPQFVNGIKRN